ncbi:MAG: SPASM domain-containing protein [Thermodesulfobacteriota bacterium]
MFTKLADIFHRSQRTFEAFQIEASTYSALECRVCPRDVFGERWVYQNLSMETFERIEQHFHLTQWVSFYGWGDPMENEHIFSMIRRAKEKGCSTGLSTNGTHVDESLSGELLSAGLDLMVIFVEVAAQEVRSTLGAGPDFQRIMDQVGRFIRSRNSHGSDTPKVKVSFPMTRMNLRELPGLVPLAVRMGVDEVGFHNLDYLPDESCNILRAFHHESPTATFEKSLDEVRRAAKDLGLTVKTAPLKVEEKLVCELNPHRRVFFSAGGDVAPCPYLMIPKKGDIRRIFVNRVVHVPQTSFGNVRDEDFPAIWKKEPYRQFRDIFEQRNKAETNTVQLLDAFSNISASMLEQMTPKTPPPLSELCRTCYKAYGI